MPQTASFHDSAQLWCLNDKSSKIHIYATWSKWRKRHSKPNLLFENSVSKCLLGKNVKKAKPRGHGELVTLVLRFLLEFCFHVCSVDSEGSIHTVARNENSVYVLYVPFFAAAVLNSLKDSVSFVFLGCVYMLSRE